MLTTAPLSVEIRFFAVLRHVEPDDFVLARDAQRNHRTTIFSRMKLTTPL